MNGQAQTVQGAAHGYLQRGWRVVPIPSRRKAPVLDDWPHLQLEEADLAVAFGNGENIGLLTGEPSGGLVDVDLDSPEGQVLAERLLPPTGRIHGRASKPRSHFWYICDQPPQPAKFQAPDGTTLVELRSTGQQTLVPPSLHPSGEPLRWEQAGDPSLVDAQMLRRRTAHLAAAALLSRSWPRPGSRHDAALALAGTLLRVGWAESQATGFIRAVAEASGDEEVRARVRDVTSTARRLSEGRPATGIPSLKALFGEDVVRRLCDWLSLNQHSDSSRPPLPAPALPIEQARVSSRLTFIPLGDLMSQPEEEVRWVVVDRLPAAGISLIAGRPKAGKSTLARCLVLAVARGEPWLGFPTLQGSVLYLALEEKETEVRRHFEAMGASGDEPVFIYSARAPQDGVTLLRQAAEERRPRLIIVDPLLRLVRVRDANDYALVTAALEPLLALARETEAHVLAVHHLGKGNHQAGDAILGSTAIFATVDTSLILKRSDKYRTLSSIQRYGEDLEEIVLVFDPETRSVMAGPPRQEADELHLASGILAYLGARREPVEEAEIHESVEGRRAVKVKTLRRLVEEGRVVRSGQGRKGAPYHYALAGSRLVVPNTLREPVEPGSKISERPHRDWTNSGSPDFGQADSGSGDLSNVAGAEPESSEVRLSREQAGDVPLITLADVERLLGPVQVIYDGPSQAVTPLEGEASSSAKVRERRQDA